MNLEELMNQYHQEMIELKLFLTTKGFRIIEDMPSIYIDSYWGIVENETN